MTIKLKPKYSKWLKKYSIQMSIATSLAGIVMMVLPYFDLGLPNWGVGIIMAICGFLTGLARIIPQVE